MHLLGNGDLDEFMRLKHLNLKSRFANGDAANEKIDELKRLKEFIILKKPNVIAVSAENKDALNIIDELRDLVKQIEETTQMASIPVELVDNELSKLYSVTKTAENEFREQPGLLKQCICLARYLQDPLLAYTQLCNYENDILALKYHPMQDLISKDELLHALECEFVNVTNSVGVDLNRCVACPHTSNVLQYVSGLGPRKANHILRIGKHKMPMISRMFLVTECTLGSKVFINCSGFIKFDVDNLAKEVEDGEDETRFIEVLDSTRIHPEAYEWARKMAIDALDIDDAIDSANSALKEILESPDRLKDLDLDAFAAELLRTGLGNKTTTLYDIRSELYNRFQDQRMPYRPPAAKEKFHMLTKETPQTFYTGLSLCFLFG
jgi:transcription elongation factor SPT6